jgi:hypothetical protein
LERGEAIGLLVILAVMLAATVWVAVRRTPSFGLVFAPVEVALAGWVVSDMDRPDDDGGGTGGDDQGRRLAVPAAVLDYAGRLRRLNHGVFGGPCSGRAVMAVFAVGEAVVAVTSAVAGRLVLAVICGLGAIGFGYGTVAWTRIRGRNLRRIGAAEQAARAALGDSGRPLHQPSRPGRDDPGPPTDPVRRMGRSFGGRARGVELP